MSETLLDRLGAALTWAVRFNENAEVAPVVLLWPDRERQFENSMAPQGEYEPSADTGPAYWLRCAIAGTIDVDLPDGISVVYLPGVAREDLRAIESCPRELAPIAELQYRGRLFAQPSGRDWTVRALLANQNADLGLDIAEGQKTTLTLIDALGEFFDRPMNRLSSQPIDASFLKGLLNPDPAEAVLQWLDDPQGFQARRDKASWSAFVGTCKRDLGVDPVADGELTAGRKLAERHGDWQQIWVR